MYNYEHREAKQYFRQVMDQYPAHPAGSLLFGVADWMLVRGTHGVTASEETLLVRIQEAAELCKPYVQKNPDDVYGWLLYGMSLGIQARVDLARKHWIAGAIHGYRGITKVKKAEQLDSELADVQLAMGAFHYYVGMSGALLQTVSRLFGLHGTMEQGRKELQHAAENGRYGSQEAWSILMYINGYLEDHVQEALKISRRLTSEFPNSPYYWAMRGDFEFALGDTMAAKNTLDSLRELIPGLDRFYQLEYGNKATYLSGLLAFHRQYYQDAIALLQQYIDENIDEYDFHGLNARIIAGKSYLELNRPDEAQVHFREVAAEQIPSRMRSEARQMLQSLE
ncbi:MAG: hypothetical protein MAGBODY4_00056 [Candidatus Marinimicrobia bacterium]|nr:hypothetical protein [Candidatus Neomarinimicrobiota bacterium]